MNLSAGPAAMSNPIIAADLDALLSGLYPGVNKDQQPLWRDARDVYFDSTSIRPTSGGINLQITIGMFDAKTGLFDSATGLFDDGAQVIALPGGSFNTPIKGVHQQKQLNGQVLVVIGTDTQLSMFDAAAGLVTSFTNLSGVDHASDFYTTTLWSFEQWGDWVVATNGVNVPYVLKRNTTTNFVPLGGFSSVATKCEIFRVLGPSMIAFNTSNGANQMLACKQDDVETWDFSTNPTAVELTIRDFSGPIIAVERLGKNLAAYGEQGVHIISYGGSFLFGAQAGARGIKAVSKNSIAVVGGVHYALQENGIFKTDGLQVVPCAAKQIGDWLRRNVDWDQRSRISSMVDLPRGIVRWSLPLAVGHVVLVYNYNNDTVSFEREPFTSSAAAKGLNNPLMGYSSGSVKVVTDDPVNRLPYLLSRPFPLAERRNQWVYVDVLQARVAELGLSWSVRFGQNLSDFDDAAIVNPWVLLASSINVDESTVYVTREAVYMQLKIDGAQDALWHLSGIDAHGVAGGRRF